jgi:predicted nucleic acid-binding protein
MRIFLDANVLFSAAKSDGLMRDLLETALRAGHACWADTYVVEEARRNLASKYPARLAALDKLLREVSVGGPPVADAELSASLPLPEKDRPVLLAAIHHRCACLVTGDRLHFGAFYGKALHGVTILSPRDLAERLISGRIR